MFADLSPGHPEVSWMAGITLWMAIWWLTEVVHLAVTSFIPFVFLPLLGIADAKTVAFQYMDPVIFLFVGGFLLAFAIEKHGMHQRIALGILSRVGRSPSSILAGVMTVAFLLSMWISNTATVMMLLSAVLAIAKQMDGHADDKSARKIGAALLVGLAYAATVGGMSTLVGTPPNMVFYRVFTETYPAHKGMDFLRWFAVAFPVAVVFLCLAFVIIQRSLLGHHAGVKFDRRLFGAQLRSLGKLNRDQAVVLSIFILTVLLWFTREGIQAGSFYFTGWSALLPDPQYVQDGTVAVLMALLLFLIPGKEQKGEALLEWEDAGRLPFGIILLFGSGFALAKGFELSGLSQWLAGRLTLLEQAPLWLVVLMICAVVCIISEFASNVASIQLVLPILVSLQTVLKVDPLLLMVPATLAASLGFMLPVATAPNTIVFGTGYIRVREMMRAGWWMDLAGVGLITLAVLLFY